VAFATASQLSAPLHPASLPGGRAAGLDPRARRPEDQTPLVDFCNPNTPRAPPPDRPIPASSSIPRACAFALHPSRRLTPARAGASTRPQAYARNPASSPWVEAFASSSTTGDRRLVSPDSSGILRPRARPVRALRPPTEVSRARGHRLSPGHLSFAAARRQARMKELRPNPIRSNTSCRGTETPPEGDSGLACDPTEGRLTRASAKKTEIRRTRGAFHR